MANTLQHKLRARLNEEVENTITRLESFDFDGTLINSPSPEEGVPIWEKAYGKEYPHVGWWGRVESLDVSIYEMKALPQVLAAYQKAAARPDTMKIMLTGRRNKEPLMAAVKHILDAKGMTFDQYLFNYGGETSQNKIKQLNNLLANHPNIVEVVLYDDRLSHEQTFREWGKSLLDNGRLGVFTFNLVTSDHH